MTMRSAGGPPCEGTLVLLACHGVYDRGNDRFLGDHPEDRPVHETQLFYALRHVRWQQAAKPLLIISGGCTQAALRCSESQSYFDWARQLGWTLPPDLLLEEYALTSVENVLFSMYRYHQTRNHYPERLEVISWGFKCERLTLTLEAVCDWLALPRPWPTLQCYPIGDLPEPIRAGALLTEQEYMHDLSNGLPHYYASDKIHALLRRRDAWATRVAAGQCYADYALPFSVADASK